MGFQLKRPFSAFFFTIFAAKFFDESNIAVKIDKDPRLLVIFFRWRLQHYSLELFICRKNYIILNFSFCFFNQLSFQYFDKANYSSVHIWSLFHDSMVLINFANFQLKRLVDRAVYYPTAQSLLLES